MNNNINYEIKNNSGILRENKYFKDIYMSRTTDLIKRLEKTDPEGAKELKEIHNYEKSRRKFGFVYEQHAPEVFDVADAPIRKNDKVRIRPDRGVFEQADSQRWLVKKVYKQDGEQVADLIGNPDGNNDGELEVKNGVLVDKLIKTVSQDEVIYPVLSFDGEIIGDEENDIFQVVINGENYDALRLLNATDLVGKADCIYIDPPYNTGNKDWIYNNNYVDGSDQHRSSLFMNFLERRMTKGRTLLNPKNSAIITTIDEKEYLHVGMLIERIFGKDNTDMVSSVINPQGASRTNKFYRTNEFIYISQFGESDIKSCYLSDKWRTGVESSKSNYGKGLWWNTLKRTGTNTSRVDSPGCFYPIYIQKNDRGVPIFHSIGDVVPLGQDYDDSLTPEGTIACFPIQPSGENGRWQQSPENLRKLFEKGYLKLGKWNGKNTSIKYLKRGEIKKVEDGKYPVIGYSEDGSIITDDKNYKHFFIPGTQWNIPSHDATVNGTKIVNAFLGEKRFDFPKSLYAVEDVIRFFVKNKPEATIIDFFGGSGTTVHAVMRLNEQDGGNRKSITITNNEISLQNNRKFSLQGLQSGDPGWEKYGVYEYATKPRITAAITGKTAVSNYTEDVQGYYKYNDFQDEYPIGDPIPKDKAKQYKGGMKQNIRFFYLDYLKYNDIYLGLSDNELYNMIWLEQGQKGEIPQDVKNYYVGHSYIIIRNVSLLKEALDNINDDIRTVYVHGDQKIAQQVHRNVSPDVDVIPLWDLYTNRMQSKTIK